MSFAALTTAAENLCAAADSGDDPEFTELCAAFSRASRAFDASNHAYERGDYEEGRRLGTMARSLREQHKHLTAAYQARHRTKH